MTFSVLVSGSRCGWQNPATPSLVVSGEKASATTSTCAAGSAALTDSAENEPDTPPPSTHTRMADNVCKHSCQENWIWTGVSYALPYIHASYLISERGET